MKKTQIFRQLQMMRLVMHQRRGRDAIGRGATTRCAVTFLAAPQPLPLPPLLVLVDPKRRPVSIRCSPSKFTDIVKALDENLKAQVRAKNFGGLLLFKPQSLDRQLLSWFMQKLNPETMKLEIGGGKEIAITEHSVWCVFQIPNAGGDPPLLKNDEARVKRRELGVQICGSAFNPNLGIKVSDIENGFKNSTGDLGLRTFFMCAFQSLLFSNTDSYIRLEDVRFTEDLQNIGNRNLCKVVVDNSHKAAHLYKKDFAEKGINAPITGGRIFLMHGLDTNLFSLPRCAFLDTKTIDEISTMHHRRDSCSGTIEFGNLRWQPLPAQQPPPLKLIMGDPLLPVLLLMVAGGHAAINLQPPSIYRYPSFGASFGQSIADVVGRSRKSEVQRILKTFDDSTSEAQTFMAKAVEYTSRAQELMARAHHECFIAMQKLLVDAWADKIAINEARRRSRARNDDSSRAHTSHAAGTTPTVDPDQSPATGDSETAEGEFATPSPIEVSRPDDHEDSNNSRQSTPSPSHGNADAQETGTSANSVPPTPSALRSPSQGVDSICTSLQTSLIVNYSADQDTPVDPVHHTSGAIGHTDIPARTSDQIVATRILSEEPIQEQAVQDQVPLTYIRRSTLTTRSSSVLETEASEQLDVAAEKCDQQLEVAGKNAEAVKKVAAGKKKQSKAKAIGKNKRAKTQLTKDEQARRDEHAKRLMQLRELPDEEIFKLKSSIPSEAGPSTSACSCLKVPLAKALALKNKIASDEILKGTTLIDYSIFISFDGNELLTTFADDKDGDYSILDFTVHCLRYDDIVHKEDSIGYKLFLSTAFFGQVKEVEKVYMDDGETETEQFILLRQHLECEIEHYYDITKAKLIFIHVCVERHYFIYCINLIHKRIDILDSIDHYWADTSPELCHQPIIDKLSIMNAAFQKYKGMIYRVELMHFLVFHPLNQADLSDKLDVYRLGGRKIDWNGSQ
ncbi:uncharacterized protein C2845_PM02G18160 [Panicum miliaceum]|uniref:Ubiquitin-like protease family profile domain-containing protein n=1 Tax=Panicum miliaceum TaxID=4540 RepID=A0A3L6SAM8_PANMI|nr:uncharacterized protein C2845_PM02G18160 [Panicum miliaceum]